MKEYNPIVPIFYATRFQEALMEASKDKKIDIEVFNKPLSLGETMKTIELNLKSNESIHLREDGCWFWFDSEPDMMRLVVPCDENPTYSNGSTRYREAIEVIHEYKEAQGWGESE